MKRILLSTLVLTILALTTSPVDAQLRFPFSKSKAKDQQASLELTEDAGPWLIMVTSFAGEDGLEQARRLALDLRENHRIDTYVYRHQFDFSKDIANKGRGWEAVETEDKQMTIRPIQMKTASKSKFEEIAVLAGDFPSVDDSKAQKTLGMIKTLQPASMANFDIREAINGDDLAGERLRAWRGFANINSPGGGGPLRAAFMLPNPMLPDEYFQARKVDHFVIDLNKNAKYSLLSNPGVYSVKVATFGGEITSDLNEIEQRKQEQAWREKNNKRITSSKLMDAAKKATLLAHALRKKGFDAYEFHDRHESYVCVGGFDWLTQEDAAGQKRSNQEVIDTILEFKGSYVNVPGREKTFQSYPLPTALTKAGIACDPQPIPVLVPKAPQQSTATRFLGKLR